MPIEWCTSQLGAKFFFRTQQHWEIKPTGVRILGRGIALFGSKAIEDTVNLPTLPFGVQSVASSMNILGDTEKVEKFVREEKS